MTLVQCWRSLSLSWRCMPLFPLLLSSPSYALFPGSCPWDLSAFSWWSSQRARESCLSKLLNLECSMKFSNISVCNPKPLLLILQCYWNRRLQQSLSPGILGRGWGYRSSPYPPHIWHSLCPWWEDSKFSQKFLGISSCCCRSYHKGPSEPSSLRAGCPPSRDHDQGKPQQQPLLVHLADLKPRLLFYNIVRVAPW